MMNLIVPGPLRLSGGEMAAAKFDMDALSDDDLRALVPWALKLVPPFSAVVHVPPRHGSPGERYAPKRFARLLAPYTSWNTIRVLVVDDVLTTGNTLLSRMKGWDSGRDTVWGLVILARGALPPNCSAILHLDRKLWSV